MDKFEFVDGARFPHIEVELIGEDGNAFNVIGKVKKALKKNNVPQETVTEFVEEATSGDYDNLLRVVTKWVDVV